MKMHLITHAIGTPLDRLDGVQKVTGAAKYAYECPVEGVACVFPVQSTIAKGRIVSIDTSAARALPGVVTVLSHENAPRLTPLGQAEVAVFQSDAVAYHGQFVAAVVAETDDRYARISLTREVVHTGDLVALMGRCCFPRDEMNATKRDLKVLRGKVHLVAQPVGRSVLLVNQH